MKPLAFVAPAPAVDRLLVVDQLVPGSVHRTGSAVAVPGGKGLNAARAAHRLAPPEARGAVVVAGLLGGHSGRWVADAVTGAGITAHWAWGTAETRTCTAVVAGASDPHQPAESTDFYEPAGPVSAEEWNAFCDAAAVASSGAAWVALSGSLPLGAPRDAVRRMVDLARDAGALVAVDAAGGVLADALGCRPDLVKVNGAEAASALGQDAPADRAGQVEAAGRLQELAGRATTVVVTAGARGACLVPARDGRGAGGDPARAIAGWWADAPALGPYATGCGDAFLAGMLCALSGAPRDWVTALRLGTGAASASAETMGAGLLDPERARCLHGRVVIEALS